MTRTNRVAGRLIETVLALGGPGCALVSASERTWASATFSGARHAIDLTVPAAAPDAPLPAALARLGEHEFDLGCEIVADCAVTIGTRSGGSDAKRSVRVELLTILAD